MLPGGAQEVGARQPANGRGHRKGRSDWKKICRAHKEPGVGTVGSGGPRRPLGRESHGQGSESIVCALWELPLGCTVQHTVCHSRRRSPSTPQSG